MFVKLNGNTKEYIEPCVVALRNAVESKGMDWLGYKIDGDIMKPVLVNDNTTNKDS